MLVLRYPQSDGDTAHLQCISLTQPLTPTSNGLAAYYMGENYYSSAKFATYCTEKLPLKW